ncbi:hypothetical protein BU16DRAFT_165183 [Lophium mytilinum]|uniref:SET domain-containing protein n=1 Tax=Lophium mytilinum TaxID=390894 RepID=A0A6A6QEC2_9PEZI|nr:hypothetical protein BU16DRAFT_165183 [Lophium mytilinum]
MSGMLPPTDSQCSRPRMLQRQILQHGLCKRGQKVISPSHMWQDIQVPCTERLSFFRQTQNLLLLRCLAVIIQADTGSHPLASPVASTLTANLAGSDDWRYHDDIIYPIHMLQTLGIDVFADLRYDTWVIRTMYTQILNNVNGEDEEEEEERNGVSTISLHRLYSMINHSCHPNLEWTYQHDRSSSVVIRAKQDIKMGEELFISYIGEEGTFQPFAEKQRRLNPWVGANCGCARCKAERPEADDAEFSEYWLGYLAACSAEDRARNALLLAATDERWTSRLVDNMD